MSEGMYALIGTLVGSFITILYQSISDYRINKKDRRNNCIKNINIILPKMKQLISIIDTIIEFIDADFTNKVDEDENREAYNNLLHLYNDNFPYSWDSLVENIYLLLPINSSKISFRILENVMKETKNMSEEVRDYLENENDFMDGLTELQSSFRETKDKYILSKYMLYKLIGEYYYTINKNNVYKKISKNYYSKYKNNIKKIINSYIKKSKTAYNKR
jgi:hypothetical protein